MDRSKWEYKKLGEVATFINGDRGVNYPSQTDFVEVGIPFVNAGHLTNNKVDFSSMNYIKREKYDKLGSGKIQKGDILFCLRGSLGKKAIADNLEEGAIASSLVIIRPSKLNTYFLSYYLESPSIKREILRSNNGSSQPNLSAKSVSRFAIPIPPISDQQRIVAELDCLNEMIAVKQEQLKEFDKLAQSIFYDMFGDPVANEKGWEIDSLNGVCDGIGDGLHGTPQYDDKGEIAFINGNNLIDGKIVITERTQFVNEGEAKKIYVELNSNTILLSINGTLGKTAIYNNERIVLGKSACYLRLKNCLNVQFVMALMNTNEFVDFLENNSSQSTIKNVGLKAIRNYKMILPPLTLQQQFADKISAIEAQKELVKQSIAETQALLDYTMDKYFR